MSTLRQLVRIQSLGMVLILGSLASAATVSAPDERDRQVLETVLLHLLADPEFGMSIPPTNGALIVLHARTPEKAGFLMSHQIRSDIGSHALPNDLETDLRRRNTPSGAKANNYDAVAAFYTNLTFSARIVVAEVQTAANLSARLQRCIRKRVALPGHIYPAIRRMASMPLFVPELDHLRTERWLQHCWRGVVPHGW